jgi:hypothetical protein
MVEAVADLMLAAAAAAAAAAASVQMSRSFCV